MTKIGAGVRAGSRGAGRLGLIIAAVALLLPLLGLLADKSVVLLVLAAAVAGGLLGGQGAVPWRRLDIRLTAAFGLFLAWCLVTTAWTFQPLAAVGLAARVALLIAALLYLSALAQTLPESERRLVRVAYCIGFAITVLLLVVELAFGGPVMTLLEGPAGSDYATYSRLNRGVSALAVLVWPLAALAWQAGYRLVACCLPVALFALTLLTQSSASTVALSAGILAAALVAVGRAAASTVLALTMVAVLAGSPFVATLAQKSGLAEADFLHETAQYRLHIWEVVSDRIAARPVIGWGFDSSPDLPTDGFQPFRAGRAVIPSHPHNGALQILVETGVVGGLFALGLLFVLARRIDRLPPWPRTAAVGMTVTVIGIAATAYSIWQSHWLAVIGAAAALFIAVLATANSAGSHRSGTGPPGPQSHALRQ